MRSLIFILLVAPILGSQYIIRAGNSRPKLKRERTESPISTSDSIKIENVENATKYAPQFKFPEKLYNLEMKTAGSSIRLKCAAKGNPLPNITWYKNKEHEILRPYLKPTYGKWFVELEELSMTDNGNYTCKVCNELGSIVVVINTLNKLKREKIKKKQAIDATVALMAEQWAKVVKIENNSQDDNSILPTVSIEKVRYTELKNEVNASSLPSEYILPVDTKWEVPRENLIMGSVLGKGEFGKVVKAEYSGTAYSRIPSTVAVKMLKADHSDEDLIALVSEMEIMKKIGKHENVVNLLGCCTQDGPLYIIVENNFSKDTNKLTQWDLVNFALQVAKGMEFLVSRGVSI
ncbi:hypothetical protein MSG28_011996 [Choristoneura fumiferana]|uniref:Uncharacterized protein n=1 Tax=Choristoneura fumiferana TaxID=7141 RepID=A0ACC0KNN7_CHOFU|nr:hypothetical protein MSG28_011996 [Choristoneura fumiferana]